MSINVEKWELVECSPAKLPPFRPLECVQRNKIVDENAEFKAFSRNFQLYHKFPGFFPTREKFRISRLFPVFPNGWEPWTLPDLSQTEAYVI